MEDLLKIIPSAAASHPNFILAHHATGHVSTLVPCVPSRRLSSQLIHTFRPDGFSRWSIALAGHDEYRTVLIHFRAPIVLMVMPLNFLLILRVRVYVATVAICGLIPLVYLPTLSHGTFVRYIRNAANAPGHRPYP